MSAWTYDLAMAALSAAGCRDHPARRIVYAASRCVTWTYHAIERNPDIAGEFALELISERRRATRLALVEGA